MKVKAIIFESRGNVGFREIEIPKINDDEVLLKTHFSGISTGTETWHLNNRHKWMMDGYPYVPGYQKSGIIVEVGRNVKNLKEGQWAFYNSTRLDQKSGINLDGPNGHIEYSICNPEKVVQIEDGTDPRGPAFGIVCAVGCVGVKMSQVRKDELVVVIGQGLIGQMSGQAARRKGAFVITADVVPNRVELSSKYSADIAINSKEKDLLSVIKEKKSGLADVVIETTGRSDMYAKCLKMIRWEGRIALQGYYPEIINVDFHDSHAKRAIVSFPCAWDHDGLVEVINGMANGTCQMVPLITHTFKPESAPSAYKFIQEHPEECLGVLFDWR